MKKIIALLLSAMMMVTVFAGCSGNGGDSSSAGGDSAAAGEGGSSETGFNVSADTFGNESGASLKVWGPEAYASLLQKQCDEFVKMYPDQKIKIKVVAQAESTAATNMVSDAEAAADVFGFASDQLRKLVDTGVIAKVSTNFVEDIKSTSLTKAVEASTLNKTLYAYPETGNGYYLVYDKKVVSDKEAGSLEDILAACKKAGKKFIMNVGDGYYACSFLFTGGLTLEGLTKDGTQKINDYDEDKVVATLKAFSTLMHEYSNTFTSLDVGNISSGFMSTKKKDSTCGAGIDGIWDSAVDAEALGDNFGACKLPTINVNGKAEQMISMYGYKMIGVNAATKYPRTSQILAYYLSSKECQQQRMDELGWSPVDQELAESDDVQNNVAVAALIDQSNYSVPQVNIAQTLWNPSAALGNKLISEDINPATFDFKDLLKNTVSSIKDE